MMPTINQAAASSHGPFMEARISGAETSARGAIGIRMPAIMAQSGALFQRGARA